MPNYQELDRTLFSPPDTSFPFGAEALEALVKMAMEGVPDTQGISEEPSEMARPQMVVPLLQQLIASFFTAQLEETIAASTLPRDNTSICDWGDRDTLRTLLARLSVLTNGSFSIPTPTGVVPPRNQEENRQRRLARYQQHLTLVQQLLEAYGEHPFRHHLIRMAEDIEEKTQKLTAEAQARAREGLPKTAAENPEEISPTSEPGAAAPSRQPARPGSRLATVPNAAAQPIQVPNAAAQPIQIPPPEDDSPAAYVAREQQLQLQQQSQELKATKSQGKQLAAALQRVQGEAQQQAQEAAQAQQQIQQAQQQVAQSDQTAQAYQQQAAEAESRAAQHATEKMQLGMRVQQMRQSLAQLAIQDPVTEQSAGVNDLAAQGKAATPDQIQQQQEQEQAAQNPEQATQDSDTIKEQDQAQRAQERAQVQAAQAENSDAAGMAVASGPAVQAIKTSEARAAVLMYLQKRASVGAALRAVGEQPAGGVTLTKRQQRRNQDRFLEQLGSAYGSKHHEH